MSHNHSHQESKGLVWALGLTLGFSVLEILAGLFSGSLALLADSGHMVTDALALGLAALSSWVVRTKKPSGRHSFGWGRLEFLTALVNAIAMIGIVIFIAWESLDRFAHPQLIDGATVSWVALVGLGVNLGVAYILSKGEKNLNTRGALLHVMGDLLGSVAALISGVVIYLSGWTLIDPLLSLVIGGLILSSSFGVLKEALHGLLDGVPSGVNISTLHDKLMQVPGVIYLKDLHVWSISSEMQACTSIVGLKSYSDWDRISHSMSHVMEKFHISHGTFQPEVGKNPPETFLCCPSDEDEHSHEEI